MAILLQVDTLAPDILAALENEPETRAFFESLATFYRKGYVRWIESAKRTETRSARIAEMLSPVLTLHVGHGSFGPIAQQRQDGPA
jgi:uncharacterized protein YdeI (YjbR/CyaY-like superfamily)